MSSVSSLWNDLHFSLGQRHMCSFLVGSMLLRWKYMVHFEVNCALGIKYISGAFMCKTFYLCLFISPSLTLTMSSSASSSPCFIICISHQSCCTPGVIKTALPNMDREVKEQYQVLIQAKDMGGQLGGLAGTTTVNITLSDVNDNPPRFSKSECPLWII